MTTNEYGSGNDNAIHWFYKIGDFVHGPYSSGQMMGWLVAGYFPDTLLIRTQNDQEFRTIKDFMIALGNCPFLVNSAALSFGSASNGQGRGAQSPASGQAAIISSSPNVKDLHDHWLRMAVVAMCAQHPNPPPSGPVVFNPAPIPNPTFGPAIPFMPSIPVAVLPPVPAHPHGAIGTKNQSTSTKKPETRDVGIGTHPHPWAQDVDSQTDPLPVSEEDVAKMLSYLLGGEKVILTSSTNKKKKTVRFQ